MSDQPRADIGPAGVTFFKEGGTVYYKNVLDARSAVGPREATQADVDKFPGEFEASGLTLPKAQGGKDEPTDADRESERLKNERDAQEAAAKAALVADQSRQAELDAKNADAAKAAAADAAKKAHDENLALVKADADRKAAEAKAAAAADAAKAAAKKSGK